MRAAASAAASADSTSAAPGKLSPATRNSSRSLPVTVGFGCPLGGFGQLRHRGRGLPVTEYGQGPGGVLDRGEHRKTGFGQYPRGLAAVVHGVHHDGLAVGFGDARHLMGGLDLAGGQRVAVTPVAAEVSGDQHGIEVFVGQCCLEHLGERRDVLFACPGQIDRVGHGRRRWQQGTQRGTHRGVELGHTQARGLDGVRTDAGVTTTVGDDADAPNPGGPEAQQCGRGVGEFTRGVHPADIRGAARGGDHGAVGSQCAGVGLGAADGGFAASDGEQQHGLAHRGGFRGGRHERAAVAEVLAVHRDHIGAGVRRARADDVGDAEICLVAEGYEAREAVTARGQEPGQLQRHVAALGQQCDPSGRHRVRRQVQLGRGVQHAEAVRAQQQRARVADPLDDAFLQRPAFGAELGETSCDTDDCAGSRGQGVFDGLLETGSRDRNGDEVDRIGHLGERCHGLPAQHGLTAPVHQMQSPFAGHAERLHAEPVAVFGLVVACADDRDGARVEQRGEIAGQGPVHSSSFNCGAGWALPQASAPPSITTVVPVM